MTFQESLKVCFNKYADFNGRASKEEFWWFMLFCFITGFILGQINWTLGFLFNLATFVPSIAVGARRLHDTNKSGWLQLLHLVLFIGTVVLIVFWVQDAKEPNNYGAEPAPAPSA